MQHSMPLFLRQLTIVVSSIAMLLMFGGCSRHQQETPTDFDPGQAWLQDMRQNIDTTIEDTEKRDQLLTIIDSFESELNVLDRAVQAHYEHMIAVDNNIQAGPDDFRVVFDVLHDQQVQSRTRFLDLRFQMVALVTPEEWENLTSISKKDILFMNWHRKPMQE